MCNLCLFSSCFLNVHCPLLVGGHWASKILLLNIFQFFYKDLGFLNHLKLCCLSLVKVNFP